MSTDLAIIKELEQRIGKKLKNLNQGYWCSVGYVQNEQNQITGLSVSDCGLKALPPEIMRLQNLTWLDLSHNQFRSLPASIGRLENLTELDLSHNQLNELPTSIGQLQNLIGLDLCENNLKQFPKTLLNLDLVIKWDNLLKASIMIDVHIKNNPFQTPPVEIVKQGRQAIIKYYGALDRVKS
jgi:Leucine-rich repeat (LRR) protein